MKEGIRKKHGFNKTNDVFAFDEGLVEKQATFLLTVRPILAAFSALDRVGEEEDETKAPDPDVIKGMLEDALVFLGNATVRLNSWRQRRFFEYLTADNTSIGGRWSPEESQQHINVLELKAAYLAIQAFTRNRKPPPAHIHLRIDNTTAVAYLNKRGGHTGGHGFIFRRSISLRPGYPTRWRGMFPDIPIQEQ